MLAPITAAIASGQAEPDQLEDGFDRQRHRPSVDENRGPDQCIEPIGLQRPEHSIDHQKGKEGKGSESRGLKAEPRPEHGRIAQRFEPESIDVIGRRRAAAQNHNTQDREQCETSNSAATRPPADYDVTTVFLVAHVPIPPQIRSATVYWNRSRM